jgi:hypothetical protein
LRKKKGRERVKDREKASGYERPGNPYTRGKLNTVDLLRLNSVNVIFQTLFTFSQNKLS